MPEVISKYPQITLQVLKEAGAKCGEGLPQQILTKCPPERFCQLPTGEICVYGIDEINKTTQITPQEIIQKTLFVGGVKVFQSPIFAIPFILIILIAFFLGILAGKKLFKR